MGAKVAGVDNWRDPLVCAIEEERCVGMIHKTQQPNQSCPLSFGDAAFLNDL